MGSVVLLCSSTVSAAVNLCKHLLGPLAALAGLVSWRALSPTIALLGLARCSPDMQTALRTILTKRLMGTLLAGEALQSLPSACAHSTVSWLLWGRRRAPQQLEKVVGEAGASLWALAKWAHSRHAAFLWQVCVGAAKVLPGAACLARALLFWGLLVGAQACSLQVAGCRVARISPCHPRPVPLEVIASALPPATRPLSHCFEGPSAPALQGFSCRTSLPKRVVAVSGRASKGSGRYGLKGMDVLLRVRLQGMQGPMSARHRHAAVRQVKAACLIFIVLYLSILVLVIHSK